MDLIASGDDNGNSKRTYYWSNKNYPRWRTGAKNKKIK